MQTAWITDTVTEDAPRAIHYTLLWGLDGVVLRTVGGPEDRVPFINEARIRNRLIEADLSVAAVDPGLFEAAISRRAAWMNDLVRFDETTAFCRRMGCPLVLVGALAEPEGAYEVDAVASVLRRAGDAAQRAGLALAVRNEVGGHCASGERLAEVLAAVDHAHVGAAWSPADALEAGADPQTGLRAFRHAGASLRYVSIRDGRWHDGAWVDCPLGEGDVQWEEHLAHLSELGFQGVLALDLRGASRVQTGLADATALIQAVRKLKRAASS